MSNSVLFIPPDASKGFIAAFRNDTCAIIAIMVKLVCRIWFCSFTFGKFDDVGVKNIFSFRIYYAYVYSHIVLSEYSSDNSIRYTWKKCSQLVFRYWFFYLFEFIAYDRRNIFGLFTTINRSYTSRFAGKNSITHNCQKLTKRIIVNSLLIFGKFLA